jgi:hypothetical protein
MPIAVANITGYNFDAAATTHNCLLTATINANDILLAVCSFDGTVTITVSGWTDEGSLGAGGGTDPTAKCFTLRASGTEGGTTVDFATSASEPGGVIIYRITGGYSIGAVANAVEIAQGVAITDPPDPPNLTPSWGAKENLWIATAHGLSTDVPTAAPTNYGSFTSAGSFPLVGSSDAAIYSAHRILNAASEDPGAFTGGITRTATIAVRPDEPKAMVMPLRTTRIINRRNFR